MTKYPCLLGLVGALLCSSPPAPAATRTWDGSSGANWTTAANWSGGLAPVNGDGLVFPAGAANLVSTNNSSSVTNFTFLTLTGSNYVLRGASLLSLTNGLTNSPRGDFIVATLTVQGPLVCHAGAVQIVDAIGSNPGLFDQLVVHGPVTLAGQLILGSVIGFPPRRADHRHRQRWRGCRCGHLCGSARGCDRAPRQRHVHQSESFPARWGKSPVRNTGCASSPAADAGGEPSRQRVAGEIIGPGQSDPFRDGMSSVRLPVF